MPVAADTEDPGHRRPFPTWAFVVAGPLLWIGAAVYEVHYGQGWFLDLRLYRAAGSALYAGRPVYSLDFTEIHLGFTYPPFALLVLSPLSEGPLGLVEALWWTVDAGVLIAAVTVALRSATSLRGARSWAVGSVLAGLSIALEPVRSNMNYGQINWILMLAVLVDLLRGGSRWRGVPTGVAAAIKLTPLVFVVFFLLDKDWRAAMRAGTTFAACTLAAWAVLPGDSSRYWFHLVFDLNRVGGVAAVSNQSWKGLLERAPFDHLGMGATVLWVILCLATLAACALLCDRLLRGGRRLQAVLVVALAELLISPISWSHHWSWVVLAPVVLPDLWRRRRGAAVLVGLLLAVALAAPYWWSAGPLADLSSDSLVLAGALVIAGWLLVEARKATDNMSPCPAV
jgi:alpha-1,2-mannosyltransferase